MAEFNRTTKREEEIAEALESGDNEALVKIAQREEQKREQWLWKRADALSPRQIYDRRRRMMQRRGS
jgi:hypothetical protein